MSEHFSPADLERLKLRDAILASIDVGLMFRQHSETGKVLNILSDALRAQAASALERLAAISPADTLAVADRLVAIRAHLLLRDVISAIMLNGEQAERQIYELDQDRLVDE